MVCTSEGAEHRNRWMRVPNSEHMVCCHVLEYTIYTTSGHQFYSCARSIRQTNAKIHGGKDFYLLVPTGSGRFLANAYCVSIISLLE